MRSPSRFLHRWTTPSTVAVVALAIALLHFLREGERSSAGAPRDGAAPVHVLLEDEHGFPRADVFVLHPDGRDLYPDGRGLVQLSSSDAGRAFGVLERSTRRRVQAFTLHSGTSELVRIVVPR